jgi:hypothetical protein
MVPMGAIENISPAKVNGVPNTPIILCIVANLFADEIHYHSVFIVFHSCPFHREPSLLTKI